MVRLAKCALELQAAHAGRGLALFRQRRSPMGGSAYGTPSHFFVPFSTIPVNVPSLAAADGPSPAAAASIGQCRLHTASAESVAEHVGTRCCRIWAAYCWLLAHLPTW